MALPVRLRRCGAIVYNFETRKAPEWPGSEINLAWSQKLAAYWSISWPAWLATYVAETVVTARYPVELLERRLLLLAYVGNIVFLGMQAILARRLVRKNYRSFRVGVISDDGQRSRRLSLEQAGRVWGWIVVPQVVFLHIGLIIYWLWGTKLPAEIIRSINSWALLLRFLVVGPFAVDLAIRVRYPGFRLQAFGWKRV